MVEAYYSSEGEVIPLVLSAAVSGGEVLQCPDGRAGIVAGGNTIAAGDTASVQVSGIATVAKTASMVFLDGSRVYWDISASKAHLNPGSGDFYLGRAVGDAASAATTMKVALNVDGLGLVDIRRNAWTSAVVLTAGTPAVTAIGGGAINLAFSATAEAQKVDILSDISCPITRPFIADYLVDMTTAADASAADLNIGVANATHASDADSITESAFFHIDGGSLNICAESDDGTTEVAAVDTTVDIAAGTPIRLQIDARDIDDLQFYINGVLVLGSTVFKLDAATGPLKMLVHWEKTSDDSPGAIKVIEAEMRAFDD